MSAFKDKFKSYDLVEMSNYFPILHRHLAFKDKFKSSDLVEMLNHFPILHRRLMSPENRSLLSYLSPFPLALYPNSFFSNIRQAALICLQSRKMLRLL